MPFKHNLEVKGTEASKSSNLHHNINLEMLLVGAKENWYHNYGIF